VPIGETMVVAIAAGATGGGLFSLDPLQPGQTMTAAMAALGFGSDQVAGDNNAFQSLYFVGLLLFFMTLFLNFVSDRLVNKTARGVLMPLSTPQSVGGATAASSVTAGITSGRRDVKGKVHRRHLDHRPRRIVVDPRHS
jgi:hypothetical protein